MQAICRAGCPHPAVEKPLYRLWQALQMICRIRCSHRAVAAHQTIPANSARLLRADDKHLPLQTKSRAIPHNSKCRYGERGAAAAKLKAQIILDAAKVSAASGGNSEPKQGQRSQSARGFCPRSTMRVPQPDIIEHFGNADAVPQPPKRCLSRQAGIVRCCPWNPEKIPAALCLTSCLCLRNVRHFPCFQIRLENQRTMNKEGIL